MLHPIFKSAFMRNIKVAVTLLFMAFGQLVIAQNRTITGKVTDSKGMPLAGASVMIKGSATGTTTDTAGVFRLLADEKAKVLVFAYVGHNTVEVKIKADKVNAVLPASSTAMEEVVVVGYGTTTNGYYSDFDMSPVRGNRYQKKYRSGGFNTEEYDRISENAFHKVKDDPLSTFSIDVDAASYCNVRRFLNQGSLPPVDAVRIEEMVNYFRYDYEQPKSEDPFSIHTEISECPWNTAHKLVMIGLQGKQIRMENLPPSNIVFLIDVSGSMNTPMKLPLVKSSLKLLVDQLREQDRISIVVYAGAAGLVLPVTSGANKREIRDAIDQLEAGGSTAGGAGIQLAYRTAREHFIQGGNNRIVLCTDGDFNVGVSSNGDLERMVEKERESGVFLTVLGYGMGNYKDSKMQILADKGNGNHAYIDSEIEAKKVLVTEFGGTLFTIAKDVKLQVEFNPAKVQGYRLIGYENRMLDKEDFNDDKKDAGELGSGHTVTALYEVIPVGIRSEFLKDVDPLKYQKKVKESAASGSEEILTVKFRYKQPDGNKSKMIEHPVLDGGVSFDAASENLRFAAAVAEFGLLLRNSEFKGQSSFQHVASTAAAAVSGDKEGYRKEFLELVGKAQELKGKEKDVTRN